MTVIEGFKYQASDDQGSVIHTFKVWITQIIFVRDFAAMGSSSFNPHAKFLVHSAE